MGFYDVSLEGFRYAKKDETHGVHMADTARIEADCAEMAEVEFKRRMGINSTVRKFVVKRVDLVGGDEETEGTAVALAPAPEPSARASTPSVELESGEVLLAKPAGKKGRKPILNDPDGLREEIANL